MFGHEEWSVKLTYFQPLKISNSSTQLLCRNGVNLPLQTVSFLVSLGDTAQPSVMGLAAKQARQICPASSTSIATTRPRGCRQIIRF